MNKLITPLFILMAFQLQAQDKFPMEIMPGQSVRIKATTDTLWVIEDSTMDTYMDNWVRLKYADSNNIFYTREIKTLEKVIQYKNKAVRDKNQALKLAEMRAEELREEKEVCDKKLRKRRLFAGIGTATGTLVGFLIGWLVM